MKKVKYKYL